MNVNAQDVPALVSILESLGVIDSNEPNGSLRKVMVLVTLLQPLFIAGLDALAEDTAVGDFKAGKDL